MPMLQSDRRERAGTMVNPMSLMLFMRSVRIPHDAEIVGKAIVEFAVNPSEERCIANAKPGLLLQPRLDRALHLDVRSSLELEVAKRRAA